MNINKLRARMVLEDMTMDSLTVSVGVSKSALYRKFSGKSQFTREEIQRISSGLELDKDAIADIFFDNGVA